MEIYRAPGELCSRFPGMAAMVELYGVSKEFGGVTALYPTDLKILEGEFMTFLGPSGCGKTTCLRMIGGFEHPTTGEVWIGGRDVTPDPPYRRDVNQVFQSYALFPHLSVRENIAFGLKMKRLGRAEIRDRVDRVLALASLGELADRRPSQLSGGQRQRAALARAIVCEPKVLLLDEPLSALDAKLRTQMRSELKALQRRLGITFIFVTHDQDEALSMSDRVAVLNGGRIEQIGTVDEIYYRPATRFVAEFIGETNILEARIIARAANSLLCRLPGGIELAAPDGPHASEHSVLLSLRPEKIRLSPLPMNGPNVFAGLVEREVFKGAVDEIAVSIEGPASLLVMMPNDGARGFEPHGGDRVYCQILPEDINLIAP